MNTLKILNIALLALIISLAISILMPRPNNITPNTVSLMAQQKVVSIPNAPQVVVHNATSQEISFHTCNDISLTQNSSTVKIADITPDFCQHITVQANGSSTLPLDKLYKVFASIPAEYVLTVNIGSETKNLAFQVESPGFFKTLLTALIYNPIYNLFAGLIVVIPGYSLGWAIVVITIIIRLVLLYPQHKMLENTRRMAELNPKIRALQKEYETDRAMLGMKMMELYKKENVSPMGSCLPLLIQFPILLGLYWVIMGITQVPNTYHLYSFLATHFNPEFINTFFFGQNLLQVGGMAAIVLAGILAVTQWLQGYLSIQGQPISKETPEKKGEDTSATMSIDPAIMQKMTLYVFPIIIGASALFFPIGLGLYWWIGLLFMIVQQVFVNERAKKKKKKGEIVKK